MKKITILLLSLFTTNAFACPCPDLHPESENKKTIANIESNYQKFLSSTNKKKFLDEQINGYIEIKNIIGEESCKITKHKKLTENSAVLFLQVGCKDIKENLHIVLPKVDVIETKINTCSLANKKYNSYVGCRGKI